MDPDEIRRMLRILAFEGGRAGRGSVDFLKGGLDQYTKVHGPRTGAHVAGALASASSGMLQLPEAQNPVASALRAVQEGGNRYADEQAAALALEDASTSERVGRTVLGEIVPMGAENILVGGGIRTGLAKSLPKLFGREVAKDGSGILARAAVGGREAVRDAVSVLPLDAVYEAEEGTSTADAVSDVIGEDHWLGRLAESASRSAPGRVAFGAGAGLVGDLGLRGAGATLSASSAGARRAADFVAENAPRGQGGHVVDPRAPRATPVAPPLPGEIETGLRGRWYSRAARTVEESAQPSAPASQWLGVIRKGGAMSETTDKVKAALAGRTGSISREEVAQIVRDAEPKLKETVKGRVETGQPWEGWDATRFEEEIDLATQNGQRAQAVGLDADAERWFGDVDELTMAQERSDGFHGSPKHAEWTVGKHGQSPDSNYQEILIQLEQPEPTLPQGYTVSPDPSVGIYRVFNDAGAQVGYGRDRETAVRSTLTSLGQSRRSFTSSHWDEPDVIAHLRTTDRTVPGPSRPPGWTTRNRKSGRPGPTFGTEAEAREYAQSLPESIRGSVDIVPVKGGAAARNERVKFIEEIQSDLHQKGREEGYVGGGSELRKERDALLAEVNGPVGTTTPERRAEIIRRIGEINEIEPNLAKGNNLVPDLPFKKTDEWVGLAFQRALQEAAEGGYDRLAWISGEQAADLYDMRKRVSRIEWDGETLWAYGPYDDELLAKAVTDPGELADYIGKEPARRLASQSVPTTVYGTRPKGSPSTNPVSVFATRAEAEGNLPRMRDMEIFELPNTFDHLHTRMIEGDDLALGGEGQLTFYDRIVLNYAKKKAKQYGLTIEPVGIDGATNLSISLPPKAREQILKGGSRLGGTLSEVTGAIGRAGVGAAVGGAAAPEGYEAEGALAGAAAGVGIPGILYALRGRGATEAATKAVPDAATEAADAVSDASKAFQAETVAPKPVDPQAPPPRAPEPEKPLPGQSPDFAGAPQAPAQRIVSLRKEEGAAIRQQLGLDALEPGARQSFQQAWDDAAARNLDRDAVEIAQDAVANRRALRPEEHAAAVQRYLTLAKELQDSRAALESATRAGNDDVVRREMHRTDLILQQIDALTEATDRAGSEAGRALAVRRLRANTETYTLAEGLQSARSRKRGPLTPDQIAEIEARTQRIELLETENARLKAEAEQAEALRQKQVAESLVRAEGRNVKRGENRMQKLQVERTELKKQLVELGVKLNDVSGVSAEGLYLIGRLAKNHIQEAVATRGVRLELDDLVQQVLGDLGNPSLTERDILEALNARNPKAQARARSEAQRHVAELKTQARLLSRIEDAEKGLFDETSYRKASSNEVKRLQRRLTELRTAAYQTGADSRRLEMTISAINDLQDQLTNHHRAIRKRERVPTAQLQALKTRVQGLRQEMRTEDRLLDLQHQLQTGEFKQPVRRVSAYTSPELERNQIALRQAQREWRSAIDAMAPMTNRRMVRGTASFLRTMRATADMGATLRQGLWLSASRPATAAKAFGKAARAFFDTHTAEQIDNAIRQHPNQFLRDRAGLHLAEIGGPVGQREEYFSSQLAERIPVFGEVVKASERSMATTLNLLRTSVFDDFATKFPNATHDELAAWANWVNVASGRGDLGRLAAVGTELSTVVFAPRFAASRIQTPTMVVKHWQHPRVRKEIAKDQAAVVGLGLTALGLAKMSGAEVGMDPRESDFGKIRIGDTRIDIWGGVQQPIRLVARIALGLTDRTGVTGKHLADYEKDADPLELLGRFAAFKLSPIVTLPLELYKGENAVGEEKTPTESVARSVLPIIVESIYDAYQAGDTESVALTAGLEFFGAGAQTYPDSESKVRRDIRRLILKGQPGEANLLKSEWNRDNPDNPIRSVGVTR